MQQEKKFVITSDHAWDMENPGNAQSVAMELSRFDKVLYVNPPQDMMQMVGKSAKDRFVRRTHKAIRRENHSLWILEPPIVTLPVNVAKCSNTVYDRLVRFNNRRFAKAIFWAMNYLGFDGVIHINENYPVGGLYLKELLLPEISIYCKRHGGMSDSAGEIHEGRFDTVLFRKSDTVVTDSPDIAAEAARYNAHVWNIDFGELPSWDDIAQRLREVVNAVLSENYPEKTFDLYREEMVPN